MKKNSEESISLLDKTVFAKLEFCSRRISQAAKTAGGESGSNCKANTEYLCDTFGLAFIFRYLCRIPSTSLRHAWQILTMFCFDPVSIFVRESLCSKKIFYCE